MRPFVIIFSLFVLLGLGQKAIGEVIVEGEIYEFKGAPRFYQYIPIKSGVSILVYRNGKYLPGAEELNNQGEFKLRVPWGPPFSIVFISKGRVPQLKHLSGRQFSKHRIDVALEILSEYAVRWASTEQLESILADPGLPKKSKAADAIREAIEEINEVKRKNCKRKGESECDLEAPRLETQKSTGISKPSNVRIIVTPRE